MPYESVGFLQKVAAFALFTEVKLTVEMAKSPIKMDRGTVFEMIELRGMMI